MRNSMRSPREEIKHKLHSLYSEGLDSGRNVLDFDKPYDFFSTDESLVLKFSSNWFCPERYAAPNPSVHGPRHGPVDGEPLKIGCAHHKQESLLKIEKPVPGSNITKDLEVLGRTPYQIGVDGEKFRVVAATLQKCSSPFVRRTFHFTSNGIVEAPEKKGESAEALKQAKLLVPPHKFVRIRRFRVIKKDVLDVEKYILPQKIKISNGEGTRFLNVRIRSKNASGERSSPGRMIEVPPREIFRSADDEAEVAEANANSAVQTEEAKDMDQANTSEAETSSASLDPMEEEIEEEMRQEDRGDEKGESVENFKCENCGKQFPSYLSCLAHVRSHQRQTCQFCSKKFLTLKMLRDHVKIQHQHRVPKPGASEDRITTATSKFGRTRQVLNVAGLRTKYKML